MLLALSFEDEINKNFIFMFSYFFLLKLKFNSYDHMGEGTCTDLLSGLAEFDEAHFRFTNVSSTSKVHDYEKNKLYR